MSLTYKLFLSVFISIIISFGLFATIVINIEKEKVTKIFNSKIERNEEIYKTSISTLLYTLNEEVIKSIINSIYKDKEITKLELIDNAKLINIKKDNKNYKNVILVKSIITLKYNDEELGQLIIYYSKHFIFDTLKNYILIILSFALLLTLLLSLVVYLFINNVSASIKKLTTASMEIAEGNLRKKINIDRKDEIGKLTEQFEIMRKSLIYRKNINEKQLKEIKEKDLILIQQSKMAAMGEMLENIAHQWRQPLSVISTAATGAKIQKELDKLTDEHLNYVLTNINDSAQYLSQTIEDFKSFFKVQDNKEKDFLLSHAIEKSLSLISSQFIANNIEIIKNIRDISIYSIENELIQVLLNILNNSNDALLKKEIKEKLIFIDSYLSEDYLIIEIKDNAEGIDENIINKVFEPYFTTKHKSLGTGIGLYMSENIIRNHLKGSLSVKNNTFKYKNIKYTGAKFTIKLPFLQVI